MRSVDVAAAMSNSKWTAFISDSSAAAVVKYDPVLLPSFLPQWKRTFIHLVLKWTRGKVSRARRVAPIHPPPFSRLSCVLGDDDDDGDEFIYFFAYERMRHARCLVILQLIGTICQSKVLCDVDSVCVTHLSPSRPLCIIEVLSHGYLRLFRTKFGIWWW